MSPAPGARSATPEHASGEVAPLGAPSDPARAPVGEVSARSREALAAIVEYREIWGYPPTLAELAKALSLRSKHSVWLHLQKLAKAGLIEVDAGKSRGIRVVRR